MDLVNNLLIQLAIELIIFLILMFLGIFIYDKLLHNDNRLLKSREYFPEDEIHSLKQIFYLILLALCFINVLYSFVYVSGDLIYFALFDIILSLYIAVTLDKDSLKNKILILLLVPYGSLTFMLFGSSLVGLIDLIHVPIFLYFMKVYYDKFEEFTESNGLGIAIILLFSLIFVSFIFTQIVEGVNPLDSFIMVSNAFTSNGYAVLGNSILGKLNSLVLVWGGYVLSSVGTATLTAAILMRHFNKRFDELEELIKKNDD